MKAELWGRIKPFVALLDARYLPLLFAVVPQAYAVYAWLIASSAPNEVAILGGVGFEMVYVGAIAWAEDGRSSFSTWLTAVAALIFSVAVAVYHYRADGYGAWLHAGFPIVAFFYTIQIHLASRREVQVTQPQVASASEGYETFESLPETSKVSPRLMEVSPQLMEVSTESNLQPNETKRGKLAGIDVAALVAKHGGNLQRAADEVGVSRTAIAAKLQKV